MDGRETSTLLWPGAYSLIASPLENQESLLSRLRYWDLGLHEGISVNSESTPRVLTVGGGKGGVGKSFVSANLASFIARSGINVLLMDLDFGGANLHTYFSQDVPPLCLNEYLANPKLGLLDIVQPTKFQNLSLVVNGRNGVDSDLLQRNGVFKKMWLDILNLKKDSGIDLVIVDLGAGTHSYNRDFFSAAHLGILTVLPEPTSIENAYVFLRSSLVEIFEKLGRRLGVKAAARDVCEKISQSSPTLASGGYVALLKEFHKIYPSLIDGFYKYQQSHHIFILMNQVRSNQDIQISKAMTSIGSNFFGYNAQEASYLNHDEAAWKSLRSRSLLCNNFNHSMVSRQLDQVGKKIVENLCLKQVGAENE